MLCELDKWRDHQTKRDIVASQWIARLDRQLTDGEIDALLAWTGADRKNATSLLKMARLWDRMDSLAIRLADIHRC